MSGLGFPLFMGAEVAVVQPAWEGAFGFPRREAKGLLEHFQTLTERADLRGYGFAVGG